jgi:hypothetical protein
MAIGKSAMIGLRAPNIAGAMIEVSKARRVLTIYTPLSVEMGSPDWDEFCRLRAQVQRLADPFLGGYDETRIEPLSAAERRERTLSVDDFGDPIL